MKGFIWLLEGQLAGSPQPGLLGDHAEELAWLRKERGIRLLVNLRESPLRPPGSGNGLAELHFPIEDMGFPTPRSTARLCRRIVETFERGDPVTVHCKAGLGRTGTILACCLVTLGRGAAEAVYEVRLKNRAFIQTRGQEDFVHHYAAHLRTHPAEPPVPPAVTVAESHGLPALRLPGWEERRQHP